MDLIEPHFIKSKISNTKDLDTGSNQILSFKINLPTSNKTIDFALIIKVSN